jgi:cyclophilin family peptidyl-prolyl cis-trans isomerase
MKANLFLAFLFVSCFAGTTYGQAKPAKTPVKKTVSKTPAARPPAPVDNPATTERLVEITTDYGTMIAKLYNSTPLHRDNFIKLVQQGFYDSLLFHRIIENFMIQGGDPVSRSAPPNVMLGNGSAPGDRVHAEFTPTFFHKKGALAAARDGNPEKASSNCQFYIVQGKKETDPVLDGVQQRNGPFTYSKQQREVYKRIGGAPFLDQNYTVFGEVISGLNVIDKIVKAPKDANNRPLQNVIMKMKLLN